MTTGLDPINAPDLARRLYDGDGYGFEEFVERLFPVVFVETLSRAPTTKIAERDAQAALVTAVQLIRRPRGRAALEAWIAGVCAHDTGAAAESIDPDVRLRAHEAVYTAWRSTLVHRRLPWWLAAGSGVVSAAAAAFIVVVPGVPDLPAPTPAVPSFGRVTTMDVSGSRAHFGYSHYRKFPCIGHPVHVGFSIPEHTRVYAYRGRVVVSTDDGASFVVEDGSGHVRVIDQRHVAVEHGGVEFDTGFVNNELAVETEAGIVRGRSAQFNVESDRDYRAGVKGGIPVTTVRVHRGAVRVNVDGHAFTALAGEELTSRSDRGVEVRAIAIGHGV